MLVVKELENADPVVGLGASAVRVLLNECRDGDRLGRHLNSNNNILGGQDW